jgi:Tfp pilus assembly protein PilW
MSLPAWLQAQLQDLGHLGADGITRAARMRGCSECGKPILVGLDDDRCAMVAHCDPHEIDAAGEKLAILNGLRTYDLSRGQSSSGSAWQVSSRYSTAMAALADGAPQRYAIVAAHRCGVAIPRCAESHLPAWLTARQAQPVDPPY